MSAILFTHPSAELYGADRTLLQIVEALGRNRGSGVPDAVVVALPRRGVLAEHLEAAGATVEIGELGAALRADLAPGRLPQFLSKARRGARFVESLVERHGIDVVHTNTTVLMGAAFGAHRSPAHHIWHIHEILDEPQWARRGIRALIRRWADVAVSNSRATAAAMVDPRTRRSVTVHNGVCPERLCGELQMSEVVRRDLGIGPRDQLVVLPGRINSWKGQRFTLEVAQGLAAAGDMPRLRFVFAGSPPPGQEGFGLQLDGDIRDLGLESSVQRIPFTEDLPSLLAAADLCLVPSTRPEPFGLVAIEAMAVGTPVVAADHGGLSEIVEHGTTGLLFEPRSLHACARALRAALGTTEGAGLDLEAMGAAARLRQREHFTLDRYAAEMLEIYASLLAPWSARTAA